jgi:hypothetical protein
MSIPVSYSTIRTLFFICFSLLFSEAISQVGIGTTDPHASSMLDVQSTSKGILTPRMTTAQRTAISEPANGLMVYDLDERAFYFYEDNTETWVELNSSVEKRDNFVLVKSEADFPEPSGGVITLDTNTYYEINGTVVLSNSINLNNAYVSGLDANEDRLLRTSGTIFSGSTGGSIRNLTLLGGIPPATPSGTAFNITATADQRLLLQNTIVANMLSVGAISGLGLFFSNIVQYSGNTTGITYSNIDKLLLSNQGWFGNNTGTFETFTGTFSLIQKVSGFSEVNGSATGINVSSNPTVGKGIILGTVFNGTSTTYVNRYTLGSFPGYNFNNSWGVECPGLPLEIDAVAFGNIYITTPASTTIINQGVPVKVNGVTSSLRMFRASTGGVNNSIVYNGSRTRVFNIQASLSGFTLGSNVTYTFFIARNGTRLESTEIQTKFGSSGGGTADVRALSFTGTVELNPTDHIEVFVQNDTGTENLTISRLNLLIY